MASFMLVVFLAGCAASGSIGNVSIPGSAKNMSTNTIGKNSALSYISNSSVEEACAAQVKLVTEAKYTEKVAMKKESTYVKATYSDGKSDLVLLCSQTEISATEKATKVTLTLIKDI